jgi:AcrR family transcriptional regulator
MAKKPGETVLDGRRLRSERSRTAIIEAMLSLQDEGVLVPTAHQVAERSGINIRSIFRHFEDMEALFEAADLQLRECYEAPFLGGDREGSLQERIEHAVEQHAAAYEKLGNMMLSVQAQMWRYEVLRKNYARSQRDLRRDLDDWLPELKEVPTWRREAVDGIASFEMWHRLRAYQGLSRKSAIEIVSNLLKEQLLERQ